MCVFACVLCYYMIFSCTSSPPPFFSLTWRHNTHMFSLHKTRANDTYAMHVYETKCTNGKHKPTVSPLRDARQSCCKGPSRPFNGWTNYLCAKLDKQTVISCTIWRQRPTLPDLQSQLCETAWFAAIFSHFLSLFFSSDEFVKCESKQ